MAGPEFISSAEKTTERMADEAQGLRVEVERLTARLTLAEEVCEAYCVQRERVCLSQEWTSATDKLGRLFKEWLAARKADEATEKTNDGTERTD